MGRELGVCGDLIYKGFEAIENDDDIVLKDKESTNDELIDRIESSAFIFFVNMCVSFERLGKIILLFQLNNEHPVEMLYFINEKDDERAKSFEFFGEEVTNALYGHNNIKLIKLIDYYNSNSKENSFINEKEKYFFQKLDNFYKKFRYGRFNTPTNNDFNVDVKELNELYIYVIQNIMKKSKKEIKKDKYSNTDLKSDVLYNLGELVQHLVNKYYDEIFKYAYALNIYTYELHGESHSVDVFLNRTSLHDIFIKKRIVRIELIYYLLYKLRFYRNINKMHGVKKLTSRDVPKPLDIGEYFGDNYFSNYLKYGEDNFLEEGVMEAPHEWASDKGRSRHINSRELIKEREYNISSLMEDCKGV
ncbi:hypothetical protein FC73_GL000421 [Fructilactobacillus fructivorans]|nr:hypothetical protein FC73_GL000421 [Fructilactobacillus fructivorans]